MYLDTFLFAMSFCLILHVQVVKTKSIYIYNFFFLELHLFSSWACLSILISASWDQPFEVMCVKFGKLSVRAKMTISKLIMSLKVLCDMKHELFSLQHYQLLWKFTCSFFKILRMFHSSLLLVFVCILFIFQNSTPNGSHFLFFFF